MMISIIIPTRNEMSDIDRTLQACLAQSYEPKEVIVIDDSTDRTPEIVSRYAAHGVRLVHRTSPSRGCCDARNAGMRLARGEVVVLLNADALPAPDFLERIAVHYAAGADYVITRSRVQNAASAWGRLLDAENEAWLAVRPRMEWSEGFSCRRSAATAVGFIPGDFPLAFCRDWRLGAALNAHGFRKCTDLSIEVLHVVPDTARTFWRQQVWRGSMWPPASYFFERRGKILTVAREVARAGYTVVRYLTVAPVLLRAFRLGRSSRTDARAVPSLLLAMLVRDLANIVGALGMLPKLMLVPNQPDTAPGDAGPS